MNEDACTNKEKERSVPQTRAHQAIQGEWLKYPPCTQTTNGREETHVQSQLQKSPIDN